MSDSVFKISLTGSLIQATGDFETVEHEQFAKLVLKLLEETGRLMNACNTEGLRVIRVNCGQMDYELRLNDEFIEVRKVPSA